MRIQVGDVVEAKLSFLTVPLRGDNFKMIVVLRDVTILDGNYAHVSCDALGSNPTLHCLECNGCPCLKQ
jgi:hypothetical protein